MIIGHEMPTFLMKGIGKAQPIFKHLWGYEEHLDKDTEPMSFHRTNQKRLDSAIYVFIKHHLGMLHDTFCSEVVQLTTMCSTQDQVSQQLLFTCFYLINSHHNHSFVADNNSESRIQSLWFRNISKDSNRRKEDISLTISLTEVEGLEKISRKNRSSPLPRYIVISAVTDCMYMCDKKLSQPRACFSPQRKAASYANVCKVQGSKDS